MAAYERMAKQEVSTCHALWFSLKETRFNKPCVTINCKQLLNSRIEFMNDTYVRTNGRDLRVVDGPEMKECFLAEVQKSDTLGGFLVRVLITCQSQGKQINIIYWHSKSYNHTDRDIRKKSSGLHRGKSPLETFPEKIFTNNKSSFIALHVHVTQALFISIGTTTCTCTLFSSIKLSTNKIK